MSFKTSDSFWAAAVGEKWQGSLRGAVAQGVIYPNMTLDIFQIDSGILTGRRRVGTMCGVMLV